MLEVPFIIFRRKSVDGYNSWSTATWKGNLQLPHNYSPLMDCDMGVMAHPDEKYSGGKIKKVFHSDLGVGNVSEGAINSYLIMIGTFKVRTLRRSEKFENLKVEMNKCGESIKGLVK